MVDSEFYGFAIPDLPVFPMTVYAFRFRDVRVFGEHRFPPGISEPFCYHFAPGIGAPSFWTRYAAIGHPHTCRMQLSPS
jgi:hypothetical protein